MTTATKFIWINVSIYTRINSYLKLRVATSASQYNSAKYIHPMLVTPQQREAETSIHASVSLSHMTSTPFLHTFCITTFNLLSSHYIVQNIFSQVLQAVWLSSHKKFFKHIKKTCFFVLNVQLKMNTRRSSNASMYTAMRVSQCSVEVMLETLNVQHG